MRLFASTRPLFMIYPRRGGRRERGTQVKNVMHVNRREPVAELILSPVTRRRGGKNVKYRLNGCG